MVDQKCNIPRGKSLGGSSTINYMVYTRGNKKDYDEWAAAGNLGWTYDELFPYFVRMENSSLTENFDGSFHGTNGSLHVEHVKHFTGFGQAFLDANVEMGRKVLDYNGKEQMGFTRPQLTTINGRRCSGNKAFLMPIKDARKNLTVQKNAFVTKIIIDEESKIAKGVKFVIANKMYQAFATKEVIVSAGAVGSPHLLMLSGVGPKEHLRELNISVIQDLPVGRNLADHPFFFQMFHSNFIDPGMKPLDEMINQYLDGKGYFTNPGNIQAIGFINTENNDYPNIEHIYIPYFATNDGFMKQGFGLNDETMKTFTDEFPNGALTVLLVLQHPKSRGSITLKSNNPFDHPLIDLNYFMHEEDVDVLLASIKDLLKVINNAESMKKFNISLPIAPIPGCKDIPFLTDDYWRCAIRHLSSTLHHLMGTCKMGPDTDPEAVVNHELKVKGIENLRIVDASIFPKPTTGHTNVPTYAVAEKASDLIMKKYYGLISFYN